MGTCVGGIGVGVDVGVGAVAVGGKGVADGITGVAEGCGVVVGGKGITDGVTGVAEDVAWGSGACAGICVGVAEGVDARGVDASESTDCSPRVQPVNPTRAIKITARAVFHLVPMFTPHPKTSVPIIIYTTPRPT